MGARRMPRKRIFDDRILTNVRLTYELFHELSDAARILGQSKTYLVVRALEKTICPPPHENPAKCPAARILLTEKEHIVPPIEDMEI